MPDQTPASRPEDANAGDDGTQHPREPAPSSRKRDGDRSDRRVSGRAADPDPDDADAEAEEDADDDARRERKKTPLWLETVILLGVALVMALIIKTFFVQAFYIPSASMEPGLVANDRILVQKVSYWFGREPSRGDVVVFQDPGGWLTGPVSGPETGLAKAMAKIGLYPTGGHLVKRVIGTPGDTIVCCTKKGQLTINGVAIDESDFIAPQEACAGPMVNDCTANWRVTVPEDRLFVMGDNRAASADSSDRLCTRAERRQGCDPNRAFVPIDLVVGKVFVLVWPAGHAGFIGRPDVFDDVPDPQ